MGGFFGVASQQDCVMDLFFGVDYHSHLGTKRGGMAVYAEETGLSGPFIILRIHPFERNSNGMWKR